MRPLNVIEKESRSAVSKSGLPEIDYTVNPYHGCLHGCVYCFAIDFTKEPEASSRWGEVVYARTNIHDLLRKELPRLKKGVVALSTITDPYQPIEARYRLSRKSAEEILRNGFFLTLQTKSPLVTIDMDLWRRHRKSLDIGLTVTTPRSDLAAIIEPHTPPPASRFGALEKLHENGISTWIFLGPVIPGVNDSVKEMHQIIKKAAATGSRVIYDRYNHYNGASAYMAGALGGNRYDGIRKKAESGWWDQVSGILSDLCRDEGVPGVTQQDDWLFELNRRQRNLLQY